MTAGQEDRIQGPLLPMLQQTMPEAYDSVTYFELATRLHAAKARRHRLPAARSCYDHLAGQLGVALADALEHGGFITGSGSDRCMPSEAGHQCLGRLDMETASLGAGRKRPRLALPGLDRAPPTSGRPIAGAAARPPAGTRLGSTQQ